MAKKQDKASTRRASMRKKMAVPEPPAPAGGETGPVEALPPEAGEWTPEEDAELRQLSEEADRVLGETRAPVETIEELAAKLGMDPMKLKPMLVALMRSRNLTFEDAAALVLKDPSVLFKPEAHPGPQE